MLKPNYAVSFIAANLAAAEPNTITASSNLTEELGFDSLERIDIVMKLEDKFRVQITDQLVDEHGNRGDLATLGGYVGLVKAAIDLHNNPASENSGTATISYTSQQLLQSVAESIALAIGTTPEQVQMAAPIMEIGINRSNAYNELANAMDDKFGVELPAITGNQSGFSLVAMVGKRLWEQGRMSL